MRPLSPPELRRTLHDGASTVHGYAAGMPAYPGAQRPERESTGRTRLIHIVSVAAVLFTIAYLVWRAVFTIDFQYWWVAIPLLALEAHNALGLAMFTVALWDVDAGPRCEPRDTTDLSVAVLIATYDEPAEVLLPTIAAAVALEPAHDTWVLDDGRRPEIEKLAADLGARYLTRPTNEHAKAGNVNHALGHIDADIVAILDADHIAQLGFLRNTLGYFDDPDVALVQTPQDFYNLDSFEHQVRGGARMFSEQAVFYRVIAAAKNRWDAAFWCGTSALLRTSALASVGGVATGTVTEDIQTTVRMHKLGWKTIYHNEVLARGMAARTASEYMLQRQRWAAGAMQVLRREGILTARGLTLGQRLGYATTLWGWFDAWRSLGYLTLPVAVIATGGIPISAPLSTFGPLFLATLAIQFVALRLLARGHYPPVLSIMFEFLRMPAVLVGTLALVGVGGRAFRVTPKGAVAAGRRRATVPRLTIALLVVSAVAAAWFALTLAGRTPFAYPVPAVAEAHSSSSASTRRSSPAPPCAYARRSSRPSGATACACRSSSEARWTARSARSPTCRSEEAACSCARARRRSAEPSSSSSSYPTARSRSPQRSDGARRATRRLSSGSSSSQTRPSTSPTSPWRCSRPTSPASRMRRSTSRSCRPSSTRLPRRRSRTARR